MTTTNGSGDAPNGRRRCHNPPRCSSAGPLGALVSVLLIVLLAATGCADVVSGTVRPAPGLKPRPLTGQTVPQVLSADSEMSAMFNQSFQTDEIVGSENGGPEILYPSARLGGQQECAGIAHVLVQTTYVGSDVQQVAAHSWTNTSPYAQQPAVVGLDEGVVALPSAAAADAVFTKLVEQGHHCVGANVTWAAGRFTDEISDVHLTDSVLVATIRQRYNGMSMLGERAITVRANCVLEVSVSYFHDRDRKSAADVARLMTNKLNALS